MGLKQLYTDLKTEINSIVNDDGSKLFNYVGIWNNQVRSIRADKNDWFSITYPAIFIEPVIESVEQLGYKNQLWNINFKLHVLDDFYNSENGNEENTRIFDINDKVWEHMEVIKIDMCSHLVGSQQTQEFDHDNLYHYIQEFKGNYTYLYPDNTISKSGITITLDTTIK